MCQRIYWTSYVRFQCSTFTTSEQYGFCLSRLFLVRLLEKSRLSLYRSVILHRSDVLEAIMFEGFKSRWTICVLCRFASAKAFFVLHFIFIIKNRLQCFCIPSNLLRLKAVKMSCIVEMFHSIFLSNSRTHIDGAKPICTQRLAKFNVTKMEVLSLIFG